MRLVCVLAVLAACGGDKDGQDTSAGTATETSPTTTPGGTGGTATGTGGTATGGTATGGTATGGTATGGTATGTATGGTATGGTATGGTATGGTATGGSTTDTGDTGSTVANVAACVLGESGLTVDCSATLGEAGPVTLTLTAADAPTRTITREEVAAEHSLTGWGLLAETTYTWELAGIEGEVTTGALPEGLADLEVEVTGEPFGLDAVLMYVSCGYFVMLDGQGRVIWAYETDVYDGLPDGMFWSQPDQSVLALRDSTMAPDISVFSEVHVSGEEVLRLEPDEDFTLLLTHDVARWGPYTYLLGERPDDISGFEVFEGHEYLGTYMLDESFPDVDNLRIDHIHGLSVSALGEVTLSVHGFDAVVAVDGDPASPTFLQKLWHASGAPDGINDLPGPTYVPRGEEGFLKQHNAGLYDGLLWLYDNLGTETSRVVVYSLDDERGRLELEHSWAMDRVCRNQGGALPVEDGALATCANQNLVWLFPADSEEPAWTISATCGAGFLNGSTRAYPVTIE